MRYLTLATMAAAAALCAAPAFAQDQTLEEVTVTSHALRDEQMSKSRPVSFADLDLTNNADRQKLGLRIADTANSLCEELNQPGPTGATLGQSCQEIAVKDAMGQVKTVVAAARGAAYADANLAPGWAATAPSAETAGAQAAATEPAAPTATLTVETVTNGPIADTPENRARYGQPLSHAGKRSAARGN